MADFGRMALSRAIQDKNIGPFLERGVKPSMMPDPDSGAVLKYILDFKAKHGDVPSPQVIEQRFPGTKLVYAPDPLSYYVDEIVQQYVRNESVDAVLARAGALQGSDPFGAMEDLRTALTALGSLAESSLVRDVAENADERWQWYQDRKNNVGLLGWRTPWGTLDDMTQGWENEGYYGFAGRPKSGKTFVMILCALTAWLDGANVVVFNKEVRTDIMERRTDAFRFKLNYERLRKGLLTTAEEKRYEQGLKELKANPPKNWFRYVHHTNTVGQISAWVEEHKPDIVFIDGAYLLQPEGNYRAEWEGQKLLSRAIKRLAQEHKVPVIISIQLNRGGDVRNRSSRNGVAPLSLSDVAGTDAYAQDVDMLIGIERTEDMRMNDEMQIIPLAVREADSEPFMVGTDWDTMVWTDKGSSVSVVSSVDDDDDDDILDIA